MKLWGRFMAVNGSAAPLWPVASVVVADDTRDVHGRLTAKNRHRIAGIDESQIHVRVQIAIEFTLTTRKAGTALVIAPRDLLLTDTTARGDL
jgi:hypothetical protein